MVDRQLTRHLARLLRPLSNRVALMVSRAVLLLVDDSTLMQACQARLLAGEVLGDLEHFHPYGLTSVPLPGAEGLAVCPMGVRSNAVLAVVADRRYRPTGLQPGESALHDNRGLLIHLQEDGTILLRSATGKVRIEAELLECTGEIKDRCDTDGSRVSRLREMYDRHRHPENDGGGPTDEPLEPVGGHDG